LREENPNNSGKREKKANDVERFPDGGRRYRSGLTYGIKGPLANEVESTRGRGRTLLLRESHDTTAIHSLFGVLEKLCTGEKNKPGKAILNVQKVL